MSAEKNKRLRKQAFVFRKPLTNEPPAQAGNRARKCRIRESTRLLTDVLGEVPQSGGK